MEDFNTDQDLTQTDHYDPEEISPPEFAEFEDRLEEDITKDEYTNAPVLVVPGIKYTLVDDDLEIMRRPLCLIDGKGYVAAWRKVKKTDAANAETIIEDRIIVIREDGKIFGGETPLKDLGFEVVLPSGIDPKKYWSKKGIEAYVKGENLSAIEVFSQVKNIIDHFIDFNKSLADQDTMCEFIACYIMATWTLDAFDVIAYIWITGQRGSGKTSLLMCIAGGSYIGYLLSPSGSSASLRDLADSGATLACDDAENLTDPKKSDPDKRTVMLAGNRRGAIVTLQELGANKKWTPRHVHTFCPRVFSSISVPDATLASRTILVPLLKTFGKKGTLDPMDHKEWPHDQKKLQDNLWAFGLKNLSSISNWNKWVGNNTKLNGRNLQPWRAILAVAKFLDESGAPSLYERMENLSVSYQDKRLEVEVADLNRVVLEALCECAVSAIGAISAIQSVKSIKVPVSDVVTGTIKIITDQDIDLNTYSINNRRIGNVIGGFMFKPTPRAGGKGSRLWEIDLDTLVGLADACNIDFRNSLLGNGKTIGQYLNLNGTNGTNGTDGSRETKLPPLEGSAGNNEPSPKSCYACDHSEFWRRPDGGWVCSICHPGSNLEVGDSERQVAQALLEAAPSLIASLPVPAQKIKEGPHVYR